MLKKELIEKTVEFELNQLALQRGQNKPFNYSIIEGAEAYVYAKQENIRIDLNGGIYKNISVFKNDELIAKGEVIFYKRPSNGTYPKIKDYTIEYC